MSSESKAPRIVIIGSGFGGLFSVKALKRADAEITLISDTSHHLFQPLLYQVATGILSEGTIAPSTRDILARQKNVTTIQGRVDTIDLDNQVVTARSTDSSQDYSYDYLIVAAGAGQNYFGNDHFSDFAPGMKTVDDALELRARIFSAFERAELAALQGRDDDVARLLKFVVVGAGPTGVEMAGQIAELSRTTLKREFRHINPADTSVFLVDGAPAVLAPFGEYLSGKAQDKLEKLGITVILNSFVTNVDDDGVALKSADGEVSRIDCVTKVWAAGVSASPLAKQLADQSTAEVDRAGRLLVDDDLTVPGHKNVFVVGDMISGKDNPGVAPHAIQGAQYAAKQIKRDLKDKPRLPDFVYKDKGSMATISRFGAVVAVGPMKLHGFVAWLAWLALHLMYIIGFKNQATTILSWCVTFIGNSRGERTHTRQQAIARHAVAVMKEHENGSGSKDSEDSGKDAERAADATSGQPKNNRKRKKKTPQEVA